MRASQINGCAFSIDMHSKDARVNGETEQRLYALFGLLGGRRQHSYWRSGSLTDSGCTNL